jgi:multicomponent Na+:H+ antiporter subunit E
LTPDRATDGKAQALGQFVVLVGLFAAVWLVVAGPQAGSWLIGVPAVAAAVWARHRLAGRLGRLPSVAGMLSFVPFFVRESIRGGWDVARRVLRRRMKIHPGFADWRTRLPGRAEQVFFVNCVSLLPGTLAADLDDGMVRIHLLDDSLAVDAELAALERAVARIYDVALVGDEPA